MKTTLTLFLLIFLSGEVSAQKYIHTMSVGLGKQQGAITAKDSMFQVLAAKDTVFMVDGRRLPKGQNLNQYDSLFHINFVWQHKDTMLILAETYGNRPKSLEELPEDALIFVNNVSLVGKHFLRLLGKENYTIENLSRSRRLYNYNTKSDDFKMGEVTASQVTPFLPQNFFTVKKYTLESIRYRCFAALPMLDFFSGAEEGHRLSNQDKKPLFMVDGRLQSPDFEWEILNPADYRKVWVYSPAIAKNFLGQRAQYGLIDLITKKSNLVDGHFLTGIRIIGEQQNKNGNWQTTIDTTVLNMNAFEQFRKKKILEQGPIYMINGEVETETMNRKTIDIGHITEFYVRKQKRENNEKRSFGAGTMRIDTREGQNKMYQDTIFIKTSGGYDRFAVDRQTNLQIIMEELAKMRMPPVEEILPIYFIDTEEVSLEKLQQYRPKDFESVDVLDKTDAIKTYGKKGENGVVIYKLKKKI